MYKLITVIAILLVGGLGFLYIDGQQQMQRYQQETAALQLQLDALRQDVSELKNKVQVLDKSSVQGLMREANNAVLEGWQALMLTVEKEIKKARGSVEKSEPEPVPEPAPAEESGSGKPAAEPAREAGE